MCARWSFVVEAGIKIFGIGIPAYFTDIFNAADFVIVLSAVVLKWGMPSPSSAVLGHRIDFLRSVRV